MQAVLESHHPENTGGSHEDERAIPFLIGLLATTRRSGYITKVLSNLQVCSWEAEVRIRTNWGRYVWMYETLTSIVQPAELLTSSELLQVVLGFTNALSTLGLEKKQHPAHLRTQVSPFPFAGFRGFEGGQGFGSLVLEDCLWFQGFRVSQLNTRNPLPLLSSTFQSYINLLSVPLKTFR